MGGCRHWGVVAIVCALLPACAPQLYAAPPPRDSREASPPPTVPRPTLASAHLSLVDDPALDGLDGLFVVFDHEVDAASVDPRAFAVSRASRGPIRPRRAVLAPASEDDENRSILLIGDFGGTTEDTQPTHVAVIGPLFSEGGLRLSGLGATVTPFEASPRVVLAQLFAAGPGRCEGAVSVLRTYWSEPLRGVETADLEQIDIHGLDPAPRHPTAFDDHATAFEEAGQDNVLDLCLAGAASTLRVSVAAGLFRDVSGHPSAEVQLEVGHASTAQDTRSETPASVL